MLFAHPILSYIVLLIFAFIECFGVISMISDEMYGGINSILTFELSLVGAIFWPVGIPLASLYIVFRFLRLLFRIGRTLLEVKVREMKTYHLERLDDHFDSTKIPHPISPSLYSSIKNSKCSQTAIPVGAQFCPRCGNHIVKSNAGEWIHLPFVHSKENDL